jgi:hypothetical protein
MLLELPKRDILKHSLGLNYKPRHERNYYVAGEDKDTAICRELVDEGYMTEWPELGALTGGAPFFTVTRKGRREMGVRD